MKTTLDLPPRLRAKNEAARRARGVKAQRYGGGGFKANLAQSRHRQWPALFTGLRQAIDGLTRIGAEGASVIADHVKLHAFGVYQVAAKLARYSARRVCNRLFQQG
jgi:hypothetical protein